MSGATVKLTGFAEAAAKLKTAKQMRGAMSVVGEAVVAGVKNMFVQSTDPDTGATWAPIKNRKGQPLRDKNGLMRSIHKEVHGDTSVEVGTNLIYAATHEFGDPNRVPKHARVLVFKVMGHTVFARRVSIPQRKFLPLTDAGLSRVAKDGALEAAMQAFLDKVTA